MDTTITIKTKKNLLKEARELADEMGLNMTTLINTFLKQFIRNREITLVSDEPMTKEKMDFLLKISDDADKGVNVSGPFNDLESLFRHLKI
jgi:addiction module RelB/DinJ family antitoxin